MGIRLKDLEVEGAFDSELARRAAKGAAATGNGAKLLTGAGGVLLGILALAVMATFAPARPAPRR